MDTKKLVQIMRNTQGVAPLLPVIVLGVLAIGIIVSVNAVTHKTNLTSNAQTAGTSFTFTAYGDFEYREDATANQYGADQVLSGVCNALPAFSLAVGDLGYGHGITSAATMPFTPPPCHAAPTSGITAYPGVNNNDRTCHWIQSYLGTSYPFEVVAGNHDSGENSGTDINDFVKYCPHKVSSPLNGTYGKQYYFDYPDTNPIARFIMISPGLGGTLIGFDTNYVVGSQGYNFTQQAIVDARSKGIKWVIVGMHKVCTSMGVKSCEIGPDLQNLLVSQKVDLILQGHEHNYQRSKQLALNGTTCTGIPVGSYNSNCVANSGSSFVKGAGSTIVIVGTGGSGNTNVNTTDPEAPYFVKWAGNNATNYFGFAKVTVTDTSLSEQFVQTGGSTAFTDSFTITAAGATPPPSVAPTPTSTTTPTSTATAVPTATSTPTATATSTVAPTPSPITSGTASIAISPATQSVTTGGVVLSAKVLVNAATNVNVTEADITYPASLLDVASIDYTGSAFPMQAIETIGSGTISLVRGTSTPVSGNGLVVATINFKTKTTGGSASVGFAQTAAIYSSTTNQNVLTTKTGASYTITTVATATPAPTPTPIPTTVSTPTPPPVVGNTYYPTGDTYVNSANASSNYSTRSYIQLVTESTEIKYGFMRFDLSSLAGKTINSAKLYVKVSLGSSVTTILNFASLNWNESQVTWTNNLGRGSYLTSFSATEGWVGIDLTQAVRLQAGLPLSLMFSTQGSTTVQFSSKESLDRPYLVIQ